jgi:hypothetical protein
MVPSHVFGFTEKYKYLLDNLARCFIRHRLNSGRYRIKGSGRKDHDHTRASGCSRLLLSGRDCITVVAEEKETVEMLKTEWRRLWRERIDDHVRAEGVANEDYSELFVERGTVILATRNFKLMDFKDVLERHGIVDFHRHVPADPRVGGWGKFIRTTITGQVLARRVRRAATCLAEPRQRQHLKKGGRGWLHL